MKFCLILWSFSVLFGAQYSLRCSQSLCKSSKVLEQGLIIHDIQTEKGLEILQNTEDLFKNLWKFIILYRKKLENKPFGLLWKGYSSQVKITGILENWKREKKEGQEIIFDVQRNASYQRCLRAFFLENLKKKVNEQPEPNFSELTYLLNISYEHELWFWTSKLIEKNYNTYHITEKGPDEIQDVFKEIKIFYQKEVYYYINLFFAPLNMTSVNIIQLQEQSQTIIPKELIEKIRKLYALIADFVDVRSGEFKNKEKRTICDNITTSSIIKYFYPQKYENIQKRIEHVNNLAKEVDFLNYQNESNRWNF